jgi:outer membrane protein OmpA-like peptidoglycan-associated protein
VRTSDPDGDPVNVTWSSSCGRVAGSGETASVSANGAKAGLCTVTATADDGRGGRASATMTVSVHECGSLGFASGSARLDNLAKAALDDIAVRMQNDPRLVATITGYIDGREAKRLGSARAKAVAGYLQKKGIDASRLTANDGGKTKPIGDDKTAAGRKLNRRVEIELQAR